MALTAFELLFHEYGSRRAIRSDNGVPFASPNALFNLSKLSVSHWAYSFRLLAAYRDIECLVMRIRSRCRKAVRCRRRKPFKIYDREANPLYWLNLSERKCGRGELRKEKP
jgi:hypothetical protein